MGMVSNNPMGRPITEVSSRHVRLLENAGNARAQAVENLARAGEKLEVVIAQAFMDGVPVKRIAEIAGTTRITVYKALERQGVVVE